MASRLFIKIRYTILTSLASIISTVAIAQNHENENAMLYNGNAFYWADDKTDTIQEEDPETGEIILKIIRWESAFTRMNEDVIYNSRSYKETTEPMFEYNHQDAQQYLQFIFKYRSDFKEIPPFSIRKIVINKAGKVVYFELQFDDVSNSKALKSKWGFAIEKVVKGMPVWKPGTYKGYPVLFYLDINIHIVH